MQTEKGARPSFAAKPVGPDSEDIGGAATIPSTNVKVSTEAPESRSAFEEEHGRSGKAISSQGSAVSLEEEDGSHHEENRYITTEYCVLPPPFESPQFSVSVLEVPTSFA